MSAVSVTCSASLGADTKVGDFVWANEGGTWAVPRRCVYMRILASDAMVRERDAEEDRAWKALKGPWVDWHTDADDYGIASADMLAFRAKVAGHIAARRAKYTPMQRGETLGDWAARSGIASFDDVGHELNYDRDRWLACIQREYTEHVGTP